VMVTPDVAQHLALIFHELATNAVKHGALSVPEGQVAVRCLTEGADGAGTFSVVWTELGGPPVREPSRRGFGGAILLGLARQLGAEARWQFDQSGLQYELRTRLDRVIAAEETKVC
jgi:two-component sensor histidine kinase